MYIGFTVQPVSLTAYPAIWCARLELNQHSHKTEGFLVEHLSTALRFQGSCFPSVFFTLLPQVPCVCLFRHERISNNRRKSCRFRSTSCYGNYPTPLNKWRLTQSLSATTFRNTPKGRDDCARAYSIQVLTSLLLRNNWWSRWESDPLHDEVTSDLTSLETVTTPYLWKFNHTFIFNFLFQISC